MAKTKKKAAKKKPAAKPAKKPATKAAPKKAAAKKAEPKKAAPKKAAGKATAKPAAQKAAPKKAAANNTAAKPAAKEPSPKKAAPNKTAPKAVTEKAATAPASNGTTDKFRPVADALVAELAAAGGDDAKETVALMRAIDGYLEINGGGVPAEVGLAEYFAEDGSVTNPPAFERVENASEDDIFRWREKLGDLAGY
jgi:hypothetical protein